MDFREAYDIALKVECGQGASPNEIAQALVMFKDKYKEARYRLAVPVEGTLEKEIPKLCLFDD